MNLSGKIIGGVIGFFVAGPIGALLGVLIGHQFDQQAGGGHDSEAVRQAFFSTTFSVMGHLAKVDGRVSEHEIGMARAVMAHMNLDEAQRQRAIGYFEQGKQADFPLDEVLTNFRRQCHRRRDLMRMFVEIQLQAAMADGDITAAERGIIERIATHLGVAQWEIRQLEALLRAGRSQQHSGKSQAPRGNRDAELRDAYYVLGVEQSASDSEVKRAYRKLMSQHHPDKLAAKGLPEQMMRLAQEKAQDITIAYDTVKEARGMK